MFANIVFTPVPNWGHHSQTELFVWGISMSLAAMLGGLFILRAYWGKRLYLSLMVLAFLCFVVGTVTATRGHARQAMKRMEQHKKEQAAEASKPPPKPKEPEPALIVPYLPNKD